ncbi:MAG: hypothetical protein WD966_00645 [Nitrosopumilaceae archaeon]
MIIKLLIIGIVLVAGVALIYPEEIIQFSKGFTLQEKTEQNFIDLKDDTIDEVGDTIDEAGDIIGETFHKAGNKIEDTVNNLYRKTKP